MSLPTSTPYYRTGKICYLEIPATNVSEAAQFYQRVFGWHIRQHDDGATAFDDTTGQVSGMWVPGRLPANEPGLIVSIMVADAAAISKAIIAAGGEIVQPVNPAESLIYALFRDPTGNILSIYQQAGLMEIEARQEA
ncbi:MAG TPA: VOC family protein [Ktedonobacteraceae bacterium]